jgi:hypothetical protein
VAVVRKMRCRSAPSGCAGVPVPERIVYLDPPGIALHSTWLARMDAQQRGFDIDESRILFGAARALAVRESKVLLDTLAATMQRAGAGEFWRQVQSAPVLAGAVYAGGTFNIIFTSVWLTLFADMAWPARRAWLMHRAERGRR